MRTLLKNMRTFVAAPAFAGFIGMPYGASAWTTDAELDAFVTGYSQSISQLSTLVCLIDRLSCAATTIWHPSSSLAISKANSWRGVVGPELLVKGVSHLRVVDMSVFPSVPSGHPTGTEPAFSLWRAYI